MKKTSSFTSIPFNIPNAITAGRIILTPFLVLFSAMSIIYPETSFGIISSSLFTAIVLSDIADGFTARKLNLATEEGKYLDVYADFFYRIIMLTLFYLTGEINLSFIICFVILFILFIIGYCPFKLLSSKKLLLYSGKSVPVLVTLLIGCLVADKALQFPAVLRVFLEILKTAVFCITLVSILIKMICHGGDDLTSPFEFDKGLLK